MRKVSEMPGLVYREQIWDFTKFSTAIDECLQGAQFGN